MTMDQPQPSDSPSPLHSVYANAMGLRSGPFDLTVDFGHAIPEEDEAEFNPQVRVSMSYHHAASLAAALRQAIEHHEKQTGHQIAEIVFPSPQPSPDQS